VIDIVWMQEYNVGTPHTTCEQATFSKKKTGRHQMDYARGEGSQGCQVSEALPVLIFATHLAYLFSKSSLDF